MKESAGKILIVVQNLPVPLDRRVWLEATTLARNGYQVSVISPTSKEFPRHRETVDGVSIFRYTLPLEAKGFWGYVFEFVYAWLATAWLSLVVWASRGFDVLHACNPPDTYFLLGMFYRFFGKKFVFDHHDLSPEMYRAKFTKPSPFLWWILKRLEKATMKTASVVISTNESYRQVALSRGGKNPDDVFVVRTGPDLTRLQPVTPDADLKRGKPYLVCYLGEMCPQDGVDYLLRSIKILVHQRQRTDVAVTLIGGGPALEALKNQCRELGLDDTVHFTGRVSDRDLCRYLSTADVCVDPDPWTEWADHSTMNKILEYMSFAKPIVSFDLTEARNSADGAALYVPANDVDQFSRAIEFLLDDENLRKEMGALGRDRIVQGLSWDHMAPRLLQAYSKLFSNTQRGVELHSSSSTGALKGSRRQLLTKHAPIHTICSGHGQS